MWKDVTPFTCQNLGKTCKEPSSSQAMATDVSAQKSRRALADVPWLGCQNLSCTRRHTVDPSTYEIWKDASPFTCMDIGKRCRSRTRSRSRSARRGRGQGLATASHLHRGRGAAQRSRTKARGAAPPSLEGSSAIVQWLGCEDLKCARWHAVDLRTYEKWKNKSPFSCADLGECCTLQDADPFDVLGLGRAASLAEIRERYLYLSKLSHPDRGGDLMKFNCIQRAYETLAAVR